jgi:hypothetical protein
MFLWAHHVLEEHHIELSSSTDIYMVADGFNGETGSIVLYTTVVSLIIWMQKSRIMVLLL